MHLYLTGYHTELEGGRPVARASPALSVSSPFGVESQKPDYDTLSLRRSEGPEPEREALHMAPARWEQVW